MEQQRRRATTSLLRISEVGNSTSDEVPTFYLLFGNSPCQPQDWWMRFFVSEGFQHVRLLTQLGPVCSIVDQWKYVIMQQCVHNTLHPGQPMPVELVAQAMAMGAEKVVKLQVRPREDVRVWWPCNALPTCVNLCKSLMGVTCWVQTPLQLYKWALANGGEIIEQGS